MLTEFQPNGLLRIIISKTWMVKCQWKFQIIPRLVSGPSALILPLPYTLVPWFGGITSSSLLPLKPNLPSRSLPMASRPEVLRSNSQATSFLLLKYLSKYLSSLYIVASGITQVPMTSERHFQPHLSLCPVSIPSVPSIWCLENTQKSAFHRTGHVSQKPCLGHLWHREQYPDL